ncbi:hypothetical protein VTO42DRAFT_8406 [Malbranchea cinnamomea]
MLCFSERRSHRECSSLSFEKVEHEQRCLSRADVWVFYDERTVGRCSGCRLLWCKDDGVVHWGMWGRRANEAIAMKNTRIRTSRPTPVSLTD